MSVVIVIPARFASSRLPKKMLMDSTGWPLIRHTYAQAKKSRYATQVIIATDHESIQNACLDFGAQVIMTSPHHPSGTDRLAEIAQHYLPEAEMIVNVQGDEPEIDPAHIDTLIQIFRHSSATVGTLAAPFPANKTQGAGSPFDPHCVKVVLGQAFSPFPSLLAYQALYFSRSLIPYPRITQGQILSDPTSYFLHLGIYAYRPDFLKQYAQLPQGPLEKTEQLEQLRALENGFKIIAGLVPHSHPGIDTQEAYTQFVLRNKKTKGLVV